MQRVVAAAVLLAAFALPVLPAAAGREPRCAGEVVTVSIAAGDRPTDGDDVILGTAERDVIEAGAGNDIVCSLGGSDLVRLGPGADGVRGGHGADYLAGGGRNDWLEGGPGTDQLMGGPGTDFCADEPLQASVEDCDVMFLGHWP